MKLPTLLTLCLALALVGCGKSKDTSKGNADDSGGATPEPITEDEARTAVKNFAPNFGDVFKNVKSVELLSPLIPPSEKYFQDSKGRERNSVACYVLIECAPRPGETVGFRQPFLVVVTKSSGKFNASERGKLGIGANYYFGSKQIVQETFGEEWVQKNPEPQVPKK
jgi:hypothetical protein